MKKKKPLGSRRNKSKVSKKSTVLELKRSGMVFVFGESCSAQIRAEVMAAHLMEWQLEQMKPKQDVGYFAGKMGPVWFVQAPVAPAQVSHGGKLETSSYAWAREAFGSVVQQAQALGLNDLVVSTFQLEPEQLSGMVVGERLAQYRYFGKKPALIVNYQGMDSSILDAGYVLAAAVNWARELSNAPPNRITPEGFEREVRHMFKSQPSVKVEVWDEKKLRSENMGMHLAVGQGSAVPPRLLILRYTPKSQSKNSSRARALRGQSVGKTNFLPIALVGKGITFDSGGLDIKPSSGMRLMKKDMAGAASVAAILKWVAETGYHRPVVAYLALAENMVGSRSFRPGDIVRSRAGLEVEIHNTDAEGRLVMGDAIDLAVTSDPKPEFIIDLATLTGAIKTALGAEISGLFSNDDSLSQKVEIAAQEMGELTWRMPLFSKYFNSMTSNFADFVNASDGFGGAITAALFLEKFTRQTSWVHMDIYGWTDRPTGSLSQTGANGQAVQTLVRLLSKI